MKQGKKSVRKRLAKLQKQKASQIERLYGSTAQAFTKVQDALLKAESIIDLVIKKVEGIGLDKDEQDAWDELVQLVMKERNEVSTGTESPQEPDNESGRHEQRED